MKQIITATLLMGLFTGYAVAEDNIPTAVKNNNDFAFDLYGKLAAKEGNLFVSPYSLSTAFGMTWAGARGGTEKEIAKTFHFTLGQDGLHPTNAALIKQLNGDGKERKFELTTANALWGQKDFGFLDDFLKTTRDNYGAGFQSVDYKSNPDGARKTINDWVEKQTKDRIKDLLPSGIITTDTRLVLTNAIYFKAGWDSTFTKEATKEGPFEVNADTKVAVPLMHQTAKFSVLNDDTFQVVELPYRDKELSMVIVLPKKKDGLAEVEKTLTAEKLTKWLGSLQQTNVHVTLPRFEMTSEFKLNDVLAEMGMPLAFDGAKADFSGMNAKNNLYITAVMHKTFVVVNEEGTEAAGATGVVVGEKAVPLEFKADHPFVFLIRENKTGSILFMGRVVNPKK